MNPYRILQLEPGADRQAVKKAYFKLIRQFPPEKAPERFKEIREAYEYLQEEANLAEMQKSVQLPKEFEKQYYQVLEWVREKEYDKAIALCERVLSITELLEFRILLGKVYILNENSGKAVKLWEELCKKDKDNPEYLEQLGDAYGARGWGVKAFHTYCTLYKRNLEKLSFYEKLIDLSASYGTPEFTREITEHILAYYRRVERRTREETHNMSNILYTVSEYMSKEDCTWLLRHSDDILEIMTETPTEFSVYANTILHNFNDLMEILESGEAADSAAASYEKFIISNEEAFLAENRYQLQFAKVHLEELKIKKDDLILDKVKESLGLWYRQVVMDAVDEEENPELLMIRQMMEDDQREEYLYDTLLYLIHDLEAIMPSLKRIREKYPLLNLAMGKYLDEMLNCTNPQYLFGKYEKKYKKLMGYPSGAMLTLNPKEDSYDSYENGTYQREGAKIGRNDPCPCGSGKKYKKCCGR